MDFKNKFFGTSLLKSSSYIKNSSREYSDISSGKFIFNEPNENTFILDKTGMENMVCFWNSLDLGF